MFVLLLLLACIYSITAMVEHVPEGNVVGNNSIQSLTIHMYIYLSLYNFNGNKNSHNNFYRTRTLYQSEMADLYIQKCMIQTLLCTAQMRIDSKPL